MAAFLGVRLSNATAASVIAEHPGMTQHILAYHQVIRWHAELLAGNASLPCNAMFTSDISSCKGWCTRKVDNYDALEDVQLILRGGRLRSKCRARGLGFQHDPQGPVQLVFHVRTGDICLFCRTSYFVSVFAQIKAALGDRPVHVTFESQTPLRFRDSAIQEEPLFAGATFAVNASLLATVCDFVTADIVGLERPLDACVVRGALEGAGVAWPRALSHSKLRRAVAGRRCDLALAGGADAAA